MTSQCPASRQQPARRSSRAGWRQGCLQWALLLLALCSLQTTRAADSAVPVATQGEAATRLWMSVGERRFAVTLADTSAARALAALLPLTLDLEELNGNEKKQELSQALPVAASRPGRIYDGDILLWGSRTLVVFYQTFDSPYSYTRLGRVDDPAGLTQALGQGDVRVSFARQ